MSASTKIGLDRADRPEIHLEGLRLSDGCVAAQVCLFNERRHNAVRWDEIAEGRAEQEIEQVARAAGIVKQRLERLREKVRRRVGEAEAGIFDVQSMILEDPALTEKIHDRIRRERLNAEAAVVRTLDEAEASLQELDNDYIRERSSDFGEIKRRMLDAFNNVRPSLQCSDDAFCRKGNGRVVVAEELTPSLTMELNTEHLLGFVTERGGLNCHGAILARALAIPCVGGIPDIRNRVSCGDEILVDGTRGVVTLWPSGETVLRSGAACTLGLGKAAFSPCVSGLTVMANIRRSEDVDEALEFNAEGIGLYRTEVEIIGADSAPDEDMLYEKYRYALEQMDGRRIVFRLFDIGSDKKPAFLDLPQEENPALGWRGGRFLVKEKALLRTQARALARASAHGPVDVMYPMVVDREQFQELRSFFERETADLPRETIRHGVMLEVPAACLDAQAIMEVADFASIGTNDLTQYLFAVDRNNENVAGDYDCDKPVFWRLLDSIAQAGRTTGTPVSVCGEIAGDRRHLRRLMDLGLTTLSVSTRRIPEVRQAALVRRA